MGHFVTSLPFSFLALFWTVIESIINCTSKVGFTLGFLFVLNGCFLNIWLVSFVPIYCLSLSLWLTPAPHFLLCNCIAYCRTSWSARPCHSAQGFQPPPFTLVLCRRPSASRGQAREEASRETVLKVPSGGAQADFSVPLANSSTK